MKLQDKDFASQYVNSFVLKKAVSYNSNSCFYFIHFIHE